MFIITIIAFSTSENYALCVGVIRRHPVTWIIISHPHSIKSLHKFENMRILSRHVQYVEGNVF